MEESLRPCCGQLISRGGALPDLLETVLKVSQMAQHVELRNVGISVSLPQECCEELKGSPACGFGVDRWRGYQLAKAPDWPRHRRVSRRLRLRYRQYLHSRTLEGIGHNPEMV